ncbi:MAG: hypothetical protein ACREU7_07370, partial [Burkholderiales bacterium]
MKSIVPLFALLGLASPVVAQALADPTRPPLPQSANSLQTGTATPASRLTSVLISPGRRIAVIDGNAVSLGGKVGDATLVGVSETEVVLRKGEETEVLKLLATAEK